MDISLAHYLIVSGILFSLGLVGVVVRRNAIVILMCLELMLNAANLAFVAFHLRWSAVGGGMDGKIFVFFSITVAAAEAAVMLAIIIAVYRQRQTVDVDQMELMKG
jgi:NADH-quinone oxidoreductase subunit K